MESTLVVQSHCQPLPHSWLSTCIDSVASWSRQRGFDYEFVDDALFDYVDDALCEKFAHRKIILTDLARLELIHARLKKYARVVWFDADVLVFNPEALRLPNIGADAKGYMLGREIWVQKDAIQAPESASVSEADTYKSYKKVHNAFLLFEKHNAFLDFYRDHATELLRKLDHSTEVPDQFIGPKLLTALHNIVQCPVFESVGVLSPSVVLDILRENTSNSSALKLMLSRSSQPLASANLCSSSVRRGELKNDDMEKLCELLLKNKTLATNTH